MRDYVDVMFSALDLRLGFALLRCKEGLDFSEHIASEQQIIREVPYSEQQEEEGKKRSSSPGKKTRKVSTAVYRGHDGNRLDNQVVTAIQQFKV